ncbi:MAG: hypothetical protein ABIJ44_08845, partial [Pseudomonadota bacterium]
MQSQCSRALGRVLLIVWCVVALLWLGNSPSLAQEPGKYEKVAISQEIHQWQVLATSPGVQVLSEHRKTPGQILSSGANPLDVAQDWLAKQGFEEGRNDYKGKLLYMSLGSATINATPDDPNFIDS